MLGGILLAVIAAFGMRWEDQADERRETRDAQYRHETGLALSDANVRVEEAKAQAAKAGEGTAKALADAAAANKAAGEANERSKAMELELVKQRERAAAAERSLLQLRIQVAPRGFSPELRVTLLSALRAVTEKGDLDVEVVGNDGEAGTFALQVWELLREAGWSTGPINSGMHGGPPPVGFGILVNSRATAPRHALSLHAAFRSVGFDIGEIVEAPGMVPPGIVRVMIGVKRQ